VIGEMHCEGVHAPCFMVRQGNFKYVYVPGLDEQLFDLTRIPHEWNGLSADHAHAQVAVDVRAEILTWFHSDAIGRDVRASLAQRKLIRWAMNCNGTEWG
jgi:choline-sulfatase